MIMRNHSDHTRTFRIPRGARSGGSSLTFARGYLVTMRPYLLFLSGATGIAGMSFGEPDGIFRIITVFTASFLSYGFGQALTDCFQTDTDAISSPYRPLTRGLISRRATLVTSVAGLGGCVAVFAFWNPVNLLLGLAAGSGLLSYTHFKRKWWAGPAYNSWIVAVLFLMTALAMGAGPLKESSHAFYAALVVVFFGYANFVLAGYFKDIEADRVTGYNTLPVVYGRLKASLLSDGFALLTAGGTAAFLFLPSVSPGIGALCLLTGGWTCLLIAQVRLHANREDNEAHRAIAPLVHGYILLLSGIAAAMRPEWIDVLLLYYLLFCTVMALRPERGQI